MKVGFKTVSEWPLNQTLLYGTFEIQTLNLAQNQSSQVLVYLIC